MKKLEKVFIAGGTGLLGFNSALLFRKNNVEVTTIALPNEIDIGAWFPKDINLKFGNLFEMSEKEITDILKEEKYDAFIYALGPDDRVVPKAPAISFFYDKLVSECKKICSAAKNAGIKKCVIMNSYFSYYDKLKNGKLSKYHPYIKARVLQEKELMEISGDKFSVCFLELPYIFGTMPNRKPLWRDSFLAHFDGMKSVMFPKGGGTAVITVEDVAMAVVAAAANGQNGECYPIGNINMTYKELINLMLKFKNDNRKYIEVPAFLCAPFVSGMAKKERKEGKESGLNLAKLMTQIQNKKIYINASITQEKLKFKELGFASSPDVINKIKESIDACY